MADLRLNYEGSARKDILKFNYLCLIDYLGTNSETNVCLKITLEIIRKPYILTIPMIILVGMSSLGTLTNNTQEIPEDCNRVYINCRALLPCQLLNFNHCLEKHGGTDCF